MQLVPAALVEICALQNYQNVVRKKSALGTRTLIWLA